MRKEAVHTLILNVPMFKGMSFSNAQDARYMRFSALEDGAACHYNLRVRLARAPARTRIHARTLTRTRRSRTRRSRRTC
jgi:hypothetical protein